jgi:CP family cyanate transporter-like MFS transporter
MSKKRNVMFILAIILAGCVMRAPITAVGTLVSMIREDLNVSASAAGMITTIPLIAFAVVSPFVGKISAKIGFVRAMLCGLCIIFVGALIRSYCGTAGLFIGTALMGIGISFGNVLIPTVIKWKAPDRVGEFTGIYVVALAIFSGIAAAVSVPLAQTSFGWKNTLSVWMVMIAAAILVWSLQKDAREEPDVNESQKVDVSEEDRKEISVYKSHMAWWVTLMVGLQSLLYFCFVAWLPTLLAEKGFDAVTAGYLTTFNQLIGMPLSFIIPVVAAKRKDQRALSVGVVVVYFVGMFLLLVNHSLPTVILALLCTGVGAGALMSLVTCIVALRAKDARQAAALSGMSQFIGYILAAAGPTVLGKLYDITGTFTVSVIVLLVILVVEMVASFFAGADRAL